MTLLGSSYVEIYPIFRKQSIGIIALKCLFTQKFALCLHLLDEEACIINVTNMTTYLAACSIAALNVSLSSA